jgi:hypothetical protein
MEVQLTCVSRYVSKILVASPKSSIGVPLLLIKWLKIMVDSVKENFEVGN